MTKGIDWTSEMIHELKRLMALDENLSFGVIALRMSTKFGVTFSRNSTVGKAHRLQMPPRPLREYVIQPRDDRMVTLRPPPQRSAPSRRRGGKHLVDLNYGDCKWPSGTGPYLFCGKPAAGDGSPYCASHTDMAYVKPNKSWA